MQELKIIAGCLLIVAVIALLYVFKYHSSSTLTEGDKTGIKVAQGLAVACIIVAAGLGIKMRHDNGLKISDYLQMGVVVLAVILTLMSYYEHWGDSASIMLVLLSFLATAQLVDF